MVERKQYMEKLKKVKDMKIIKVITGVRRSGKSTLLLMFRDYLKECGTEEKQIISLNFEDIENEYLLDYKKLHAYVTERLVPGRMTYVFLDEIQNVPEFQKTADSLFIRENVDLYITGSNARLLSGELSTLLSGRYIEISLLPLSFSEYWELTGGDKQEAWIAYYKNGGFPYAAVITDDAVRRDYLTGIYNTVLLKDIAARKRIGDILLLESVAKFLFDNIGSTLSSKKIADTLTSYGRKTTSVTVENYIEALTESFILYKAGRYDVRGRHHLKSLEKYYLVDISLRRLLLGDKNTDIGHILENIVYLELIRRGYAVSIGKMDDREIDFIAVSGNEKFYIQVAASILDPAVFEREITPLKKVGDHYPKLILSADEFPMAEDGIRQMNIVDFLLNTQPRGY